MAEKDDSVDGADSVENCQRNTQKAKDANPSTWSECAKCSLNAETMDAFNQCFDNCKRR